MRDNVFEDPKGYIDEISKKVRISLEKKKKFSGKTMAFLFLTKFCEVECAHCFFRSRKNINNNHSIEYELTEEGLNKVIEFLNQSNNGYLSVLGGGEPFSRFDYILELIKRVKTDRMILVTSGNWALDIENVKEKILQMKEALKSRETPLDLVLRVSIDKWHSLKIGNQCIINVLKVMENENLSNFHIEAHTLIDDDTLDEALKTYCSYEKIGYEKYVSDNNKLMKIGYARYTIKLESGFKFEVGVARKFESNLKVDLNLNPRLDEIIGYFEDDIEKNCYGNPSLVHNVSEEGLDFLISYNGNITTWANDQPYDLNNLYIHNYNEVIERTLDNIISYSFIDKGFKYREKIINEVNSKAVIKAKAVNIRDYYSNLLFEENATVLYYAIRVMQDYLKEGILSCSDLNSISNELKNMINKSKLELIEAYNNSNYTIIEQYKDDITKNCTDWEDLFELIRLGHYDISEEKIREGIEYINSKFGKTYKDLSEFKFSGEGQYIRLLNKISGINRNFVKLIQVLKNRISIFLKSKYKIFLKNLYLNISLANKNLNYIS